MNIEIGRHFLEYHEIPHFCMFCNSGEINDEFIWMWMHAETVSQKTVLRILMILNAIHTVQHSWAKPLHTLQWRHNDNDGVSNHRPHDCLLYRLSRHRSKKTSKLRVTSLCVGNSPHKWPVTRKNVSIWWRHHDFLSRGGIIRYIQSNQNLVQAK